LVDLRTRATDPEELDLGVPVEEALQSLRDLRFVNRWLGARGALKAAVVPHLAAATSTPRLLDVGCGSGDVASFLVGAAGRQTLAVGVDLKLLHVRQVPAAVTPLVADVHALPFRDRTFDVVLTSLFLHHFDGDAAVAVLRDLYRLCRRALVITDLRRAQVPYLFGRASFPWLFRSRVSVADGLLSIRRAFREDEMRAAFAAAEIPDVRIRRVFPYRLLAVAARPDPY
jgi:SAM-dependent methyltransferase